MPIFLFVQLFLAHILADFVLQPNKWVNLKREKLLQTKYFWMHISIVSLLSYLFVAEWGNWIIPILIFITHGCIDFGKSILENRNKYSDIQLFVWDQIAHILVIISICVGYKSSFQDIFINLHPANHKSIYIVLTALITLTSPAGIIIGKIVEPFQKKLGANDSLENAGKYIGIVERILILIFILFNQFGAIGFLLASKSILRISRDADINARKKTEYVLVGTLLSFLFAIVVALLTQFALKHK